MLVLTHPAREFNADTGLLQVDVLAVEMPSAPQERRLCMDSS